MDAQETRIYTYVLVLVALLGAIFLAFFLSIIRQQRINLELKKKNITAELTSIENERARIAADLHDDLSPLVSAIKLKVSSFDLHDAEDLRQQQKTDEHLSEVVRRLREISYNLMPVTLQRKGLTAALRELAGTVSNRNGLQVVMDLDAVYPSETQSIHLYRIVQEIVHNTIRHAGASRLQVSLKAGEQNLVLTTTDNGRGFDYQQKLKDGGGFGLRNLLSRTDVLNGKLWIRSREGEGTTYTIDIPVQPETLLP